ncbi:MAG: SpoIID/LytB domain-containing protein [Oscillibacter sp.]
MKKLWMTLVFVVTFFALSATSASAAVKDTVKVGLRYGESAMASANLENARGGGYALGYFDSDRLFVSLGQTEVTTLSVSAAGTGYHLQLDQSYGSFEEAARAAAEVGGYPAYLTGGYTVRVGSYDTKDQAEGSGLSGQAVRSSSTGVLVSDTGSNRVLFEFDCQGALSLGILPNGQGEKAVTWFKGYKYYGGFEYPRITGGNLNVVNVVNLEDYVKGVIPYEMNGDWPLAALEAQAIGARTYVCRTSKHMNTYGFDVCNTTDCQLYNAAGSGAAYPSAISDAAVEGTAGRCMYYQGELINAVYSASNGGASEDAANVWGSESGYLKGKPDPHEATITIPNYSYTATYTPAQLTWILQEKGYSIGTVKNVYVSAYTKLGNVYQVTFEDSAGQTLTVKGETCRTIFYSSTYKKSVRSMRFNINGGSAAGTYVNGTATLPSVSGAYAISGGGKVAKVGDAPYVITSAGSGPLSTGKSQPTDGTFTITGTGSGHNVGMSQYGAKAMAEQGYSYEDILHFYYTDITIA